MTNKFQFKHNSPKRGTTLLNSDQVKTFEFHLFLDQLSLSFLSFRGAVALPHPPVYATDCPSTKICQGYNTDMPRHFSITS